DPGVQPGDHGAQRQEVERAIAPDRQGARHRYLVAASWRAPIFAHARGRRCGQTRWSTARTPTAHRAKSTAFGRTRPSGRTYAPAGRRATGREEWGRIERGGIEWPGRERARIRGS